MEAFKGDDQSFESTKLMDLSKISDEIRRARECAVQQFIDSVPAIEELERLRSNFQKQKIQLAIAATIARSLESLIESAEYDFSRSQSELAKSTTCIRTMEKNRDEVHKDILKIESESEELKIVKEKLEEELKIKLQSLNALKLARKAAIMEIEAVNSSVDFIVDEIKQAKKDFKVIAVSREDYSETRRRADEATVMASWRVEAVEERRRAAEVSRDCALKRLQEKLVQLGEMKKRYYENN